MHRDTDFHTKLILGNLKTVFDRTTKKSRKLRKKENIQLSMIGILKW